MADPSVCKRATIEPSTGEILGEGLGDGIGLGEGGGAGAGAFTVKIGAADPLQL